jgi:hypothetical protein
MDLVGKRKVSTIKLTFSFFKSSTSAKAILAKSERSGEQNGKKRNDKRRDDDILQ